MTDENPDAHIGLKIKQFTYRRIRAFFAIDSSVDQTVDIMALISQIPRHSDLRMLRLQIWFGIADDPGDEVVEFFCWAVDVDNIPAVEAWRLNSVWTGLQIWRTIGTDSGPTMTLSKNEIDFKEGLPKWSNRGIAELDIRASIAARSNTTSNLIVAGSAEYEVTINRRFWPGPDIPATDLSFEEWHSDDA